MGKAMICDRCGDLIQNTYYNISVIAKDVNDSSPLTNMETYSYNLCSSMRRTFQGEKAYCVNCMNEIMDVAKRKVE